LQEKINTTTGVFTMAKIVEDVIVIKFSKIVKDSEQGSSIASSEVQLALEQVAQELVGDSVVVEVVQA
jgi:actin-like ATPase involved in cell morphogenesis